MNNIFKKTKPSVLTIVSLIAIDLAFIYLSMAYVTGTTNQLITALAPVLGTILYFLRPVSETPDDIQEPEDSKVPEPKQEA